MRNIYTFLIVLLCLGAGLNAQVKYESNASLGDVDFEDAATWVTQPPVDGVVTDGGIRIQTGTSVTRNGVLNISGVYSGTWSGDISGTLIVTSNMLIDGGSFIIPNGGTLEVMGSLESTASFNVNEGGTLIVHGNLNSSTLSISGNVVVGGSYTAGPILTSISSTGNLVVGEDINHTNGGFSIADPSNEHIYIINGTASTPGSGELESEGAGSLEDYKLNESGNTDLINIVDRLSLVTAKVFYTLASGDWNDEDIWTQDPAGVISVGKAVPSVGDNVVILTGKTVVVPDGNSPYTDDLTLDLGSVTIYGQLDLRKTSGHAFETLKGNGRLLMAKDNYPTISDDSDFVTKGEGEGTCVYYGSSNFNIQSVSIFYNLEIDMNTGKTATLREDYQINGNFLVKSGRVRLGENSTTRYTMTVLGDITINSGAELTTRTGNSFGDDESDYHHIICSGSFINNGTVVLTTQGAPDYDTRLTGNSVSAVVLTMKGTSDVNFTCNGITDLYRLIVDKGSDQTYTVNLSASNEENFRLFGCNNQNGADTKALYLKNGTLKLSGDIFIPTLTEGGSDFVIPTTAQLWLSGGGVKVYSTARSNAETNVGGDEGTGVVASGGSQSFSLKGKFRITDGLFETKSHGFVAWDDGDANVIVEGGTVITPGFRSAGSQAGKWSYLQSGGLVQMYGDLDSDLSGSGVATFSINGPNNAFIMTGGEIEIFDAATSGNRAISIKSGAGNYNVTGGTIKINRSGTGSDVFNIYSTAPFYNLEIAGTSNTEAILTDDLTVLNNLTIASNTELDAASNTLEIGGDFSNNGTYTTGTNITRFIGENSSTVTGGTIAFSTLELDKESASQTVTIQAGTNSINSDLLITKGNLAINVNTNITGDIYVAYGDVSGTNALVLNGSSQQVLEGKVGQDPEFGNLILNNSGSSPQVKLLSDVNVQSITFQRNQIFDLDIYNLEVLSSLSKGSGLNWDYNECMFRTTGLSSDGGLTLPVDLSGNYSGTYVAYFPVGLFDSGNSPTTRFTPSEVFANGNSLSANGSVTVIPVNGKHPTTDAGASVLPFYWRVNYTGLGGITKDNLRYYFTYDKNLANGFEKSGSVLTGDSWSEYGSVRSNGDRTYRFPYSAELSKDFTLGKSNDYNWVITLYSRRDGEWNSLSTWSLDSHTGDPLSRATLLPESGDRVIIGNSHVVTVPADNNGGYFSETIGELIFDHDTTSSTEIEDLPRLDIYRGNQMNLSRVSGTGIITQLIDNTRDPILSGDFGDFVNEKYSWFWYRANASNVDIPNALDVYPNVMTGGDGRVLTFTKDILINRHLNPIENSTIRMNNGANGDIHIGGDLLLGDWYDGVLEFDDDGTERTLTIEGNIDFTASLTAPTSGRQLRVRNVTPNSLEHQIYLEGDIVQGAGVIDLANTGATDNNVITTFNGLNSATVTKTGGATSDFYRLEIDKPSTKQVYFSDAFTLSGDASQVIKPINLISGIGRFESSGSLTISSGGSDFGIPSGTTLQIDNGTTFKVGGNASNTGIWLDGSLIVNDGGTLNCNDGTSGYTDNYIEYSTSGNAAITLNGASTLNVGSQIRRSLNTDVGILSFNQNSNTSSVVVGDKNVGSPTRGIFEILGAGSSFTQAENANITIEEGHAVDNIALYFDPEISSIGSGAGFTIAPSTNVVGIYAAKELQNLTVDGDAKLLITPLVLNGNLTISRGSLDANDLDVTLKSNLTNTVGTLGYEGGSNTTYFTGSGNQIISGATTFNNLIKQTGTGELILEADVSANDLTLSSGTLDTDIYDLTVLGDLDCDISTASTGVSSGIVLAGSDVQHLSGNGTFARLTINNSDGVAVPTQSGSINFLDYLKLQDGVFDIGRNLLVFDEVATVKHNGAGFSSSNMLQTNLSFVDNGIKKVFPEVREGIDPIYSFVYPIGSSGKYTPVTVDVSANGNNTGSIRVKAADERHVSIVDRAETVFDDAKNVLQYNWTLDAEGIGASSFKADVVMKSHASDALVTNGNSVKDYITARILLDEVVWSKFEEADYFDETTMELTFSFDGVDDNEIDGDYTAGFAGNDDTSDDDDAIPDQIAAYITVVDDGDWDVSSTWKPYNPETGVTDMGGEGPDGGPRGSLAYVDKRVVMPHNFMSAYRTNIMETGTIFTGVKFGHRLGAVSGTGTLHLESGNIPAGTYDEFFSTSGGTLKYDGSSDYDILSEITQVNNLVLIGGGSDERRLPNIESGVQIVGDLTIEDVHVDNTHHRDLFIAGDVLFTSGTFEAGTTSDDRVPTITFNGTSLQNVSGGVDFTSSGAGAFYDFEINNPAGVTVSNNIEVEDVLKLTDGVIYTDAGGVLKVTNSLASAVVGGGSSSYIQGPISKAITDGDNFTFPIGDQNRYMPLDVKTDGVEGGSETWEVQYYSHNPNDDGYDVSSVNGSVAYVSHGEYWRVKSTSNDDAKITLNWDGLSGVNPVDPDFKVVEWTDFAPLSDPASDAWAELAINSPGGNSSSGSVQTTGFSAFNAFANGNYFTFGSISIPAYSWEGDDVTSPQDWFVAENWSGGIVPGASSEITIGSGNPAEMSGSASVKSLWVDRGNLTLKPGAQLTIAEALTITDDGNVLTDEMVIENTVLDPSSLIVEGTITGETTYKWDDMTKFSWWHIAHPVSDITETEYDNSFGAGRYALNTYTASGWSRVAGFSSDAAVYDFNADNEMEGYNLYPAEDLTLKYTGQLHNADDYTRNFSGDQWWHIGNPYSSYIDVEEDGFDIGDFEQSVYIRRNDDQVSTYNILNNESLNEGSRYIAPGQCMWLKTTEATDAITIAKSTRTHSSDGYGLKSASLVQDDRIRLSLKSEYGVDESVVIFNSDGSELITAYDSEKLMNKGTGANLYSIKEGKSIAINSLPEIEANDVIPLGYQVDESGLSEFTLQVTNIANFMPELDVFLKDKEEGVIVNLREEPAYTFTPSTVQADDRFELMFEAMTTDAESDEAIVSERNVQIFAVKQKAVVRVTDELLQSKNRLIEVYNLAGQLVSHHELNSRRTEFELPYADAIFIIKVSIDKSSYQEKVSSMN